MRFVFMGTPAFAARALEALIAAPGEIAAVYTRPPQPAGRGKKETLSPVHALALTHGLRVLTPKGFRKEEARAELANLKPDVAIIVAYGVILPQAALDIPVHGCFNIHGSLLPRWRGAAPIQRAIMAGDAETGVQIMKMEAGLDTGPIAMTRRIEIRADDTAASLHDRLADAGAALLTEFIATLENGSVNLTPQIAAGVTYAEKISPAEARLDWTQPGVVVDRKIRGLSPFPGAWFEADIGRGPERVKALLSRVASGRAMPGDIVRADDRLIVGCGDGAVEMLTLQRAGKSPQGAADFLRGFPLRAGARI
ncbi:MAG: methionyl-tRNA formyltransferase [Parvularculaceae bacterium]|nr:methionyl-tRNA formyltransferase [Parvularculaceae bacterium]